MRTTILSKLEDANLFVLRVPGRSGEPLVIGTLHPFNLDGKGYELRIYRCRPKVFAMSQELRELGGAGWGIDEVECTAPDQVRISRDEVWLTVTMPRPAQIEWKKQFLKDYPAIPDDGPPQVMLTALQSDEVPWISVPV